MEEVRLIHQPSCKEISLWWHFLQPSCNFVFNAVLQQSLLWEQLCLLCSINAKATSFVVGRDNGISFYFLLFSFLLSVNLGCKIAMKQLSKCASYSEYSVLVQLFQTLTVFNWIIWGNSYLLYLAWNSVASWIKVFFCLQMWHWSVPFIQWDGW